MKKTVGIDIGNYSIKLIELSHKKDRVELTNSGIIFIADGDIKSALKDLLSVTKVSCKHVNVSLSGTSVIVRYIDMPPMSINELKNAIKFEAGKYIPFNVEDSIIDCAILDKPSSGTYRVLLVAAKRDRVQELIAIFEELNLDISVIDIDSFASLNSFQSSRLNSKNDETFTVINIGARFSNMSIVSKQDVYFTRDVMWGGMDITGRIKERMGIGPQEAEILKKNPADKKDKLANIIAPLMEKFIAEIRRSFDYFESQFGRNVEKIYISGGTAYLFNIVDVLKDSFGVETEIWDPFECITLKEAVDSPALFAVAVGLALRK